MSDEWNDHETVENRRPSRFPKAPEPARQYGATDYEQGVLFSLENDIPAARDQLMSFLHAAVDQQETHRAEFAAGRQYPLNMAVEAFDEAMSRIRAEIGRFS